ncbi:40S ribosomal S3-like protein [Melia azedarach]|uniref:40S ribosomal S3-like protein n=2 Tax=Melia azedarach TaxID=155640 RepID=A0ACC1XC62_MELAZ|nr:40S ribosomal S3-like protein [Melia azedarach]
MLIAFLYMCVRVTTLKLALLIFVQTLALAVAAGSSSCDKRARTLSYAARQPSPKHFTARLLRIKRSPALQPTNMATQISKKRKFVADGVFFAELNEVLTRELAEDGYSGVEVRVTPMRTEIIIRATRTQNVLGEKGRRIRELTSVVQKRFKFPENSVELYAEKVNNRGLCAIAQAESLRYKLLGGLAVRRACYGVLRFIMESGAKGCEVIVSGKLRAQRAKSMKFKDGYMISSGQPVNEYIDSAVRHVLLRQGVLGIKVKIMLDWDPKGKQGPTTPLPDVVTIHPPKDEEEYAKPTILATDIEVPVPIPVV